MFASRLRSSGARIDTPHLHTRVNIGGSFDNKHAVVHMCMYYERANKEARQHGVTIFFFLTLQDFCGKRHQAWRYHDRCSRCRVRASLCDARRIIVDLLGMAA